MLETESTNQSPLHLLTHIRLISWIPADSALRWLYNTPTASCHVTNEHLITSLKHKYRLQHPVSVASAGGWRMKRRAGPMRSAESVIILSLISASPTRSPPSGEDAADRPQWQKCTNRLGALPGLRGESWREMAFLQLTLVSAASWLCGAGRQPAALTQAAPPLDKTTSTLIWHPKHAHRNKSPDRGLDTEHGKASHWGQAHWLVWLLRNLCLCVTAPWVYFISINWSPSPSLFYCNYLNKAVKVRFEAEVQSHSLALCVSLHYSPGEQ